MTQKFEVDPDDFRAASRKAIDVQTQINRVVSNLESALDGRGEPWGNDKMGNQFLNGAEGKPGYKEGKKNLTDGARALGSGAKSLADAEVEAADKIEEILERGNRDGFR